MGQVPSQALTLRTNPFKGRWAQEQAFPGQCGTDKLGGDPAGNIQMPWLATAFFHAHSEVGGPWLSEMRAGSQSRDHTSLALKTRREARPRWAPDFGF